MTSRYLQGLAAVLLAGGRSQRMGQPKVLLDWDGRPIIQHIIDVLTKVDISPIIIVLGAYHDQITDVVTSDSVSFVQNVNWEAGGMLSSIQAGLRAVPLSKEGIVIMLGDHPSISADTLRLLKKGFFETNAPIILPEYRGRSGHPIVLRQTIWEEVYSLDPNIGLRQLMRNHISGIARVDVGTDEIFRDIDTPQDYQAALKIYRSQRKG